MVKTIIVLWTVSQTIFLGTFGQNIYMEQEECVVDKHVLEQEVNRIAIEEDLEEHLKKITEEVGMSSQIEILDLQYNEDLLILNLSEDLVAYGGGNEMEYQVVSCLLNWGFDTTDAFAMTIEVEGEVMGFPEGTIVEGMTKSHFEKYYRWRE